MIELNMSRSFDNLVLKPLLARADSASPAFVIGKTEYSYSEFFRYVAAQLSAIEGIAQDVVGLYAVNDIRTYASIVALWTLGKAYVPLNPVQPVLRHREVAESVGLEYVLSADSSYDMGIPSVHIVHTSDAAPVAGGALSIKPVSEDNLAYIIFTSGSTGKPKGVQITRGNLAAFVESMDMIGLDINENDRCLQPFDLTFDFSVSSYVIPLVKGASIYTIPLKGVKFLLIASLIDKYRLTVLQMVPSMMRNLLPYIDELDLSSVRYNIFCGEALLDKHITRWHERNQDMVSYNMYGPTEDTVFCTTYVIGRSNSADMLSRNGIVSIGTPFHNCSLLLVDESGSVIESADVQGELCLSGTQLTPGYWQNESENGRRFFEKDGARFYRTGDICQYAQSGDLMYISRADHQVKINGFRVELGEIEKVFSEVSGGRYCVVMPFQNAQDNTELALVIEGREYDWSNDRRKLSERLPKYEVPSRCVFVKAIPLNQNGKVDRGALKSMI